MMSPNALTDTQLVLLSAAAQRDDGRVILPERLRGGAAQKVLSTLVGKGLIEMVSEDISPRPLHTQETPGTTAYQISRSGLESLGIEAEAEKPPNDAARDRAQPAAPETPISPAEAPDAANARNSRLQRGRTASENSAPRAGSKLADVIALLDRGEGASIDELTAATSWLPHTTRAALTGLRKRGIALVYDKRGDGITVYRLAPAASTADQAEVA